MDLGILNTLRLVGFLTSPTTRFVRHRDPRRFPVDELVRRGWPDLYQQCQGRPVFRGVDQFVSSYAQSGTATTGVDLDWVALQER